MGFILKQVSDVGSGNPIVARLSLQFRSILDFYSFDYITKESIQSVLCNDIQKRLIACDRLAKEVIDEIEKVLNELIENGLKTQSGRRVIESPYIINLEERIESYLYNAKSCLRDSLKIYNIVFNTNFTEARYDKAIEWAEREFGNDDAIAKFLKANHELWIRKLVKMRNAIEHPGCHSGLLHIKNFDFVTTDGGTVIQEPIWYLNDDSPTTIRSNIHVFVKNILELTEAIVLSVLDKQEKSSMLHILEIPENQRREEAPIRFRMGLAQEMESNKTN
ncbi:MAG: hypothetical protein ACXWUD_10745 [Methylosarcina sp.]